MNGAPSGGSGQPDFLISVEGLTFAYDRGELFRDFGFSSTARVSVLRGPSGCGKTTFLKLLYGLMKPAFVRTWRLPQPPFIVLQADTLVPWFTGQENIEVFSPGLWGRLREGPFHELVKTFVDKRACDMSYGQRRSIELARAFTWNPPLLLLDEPFNFLDASKRALFLEWINTNCASSGRIVLTSHYVEDVAIADADFFEFDGVTPYRSLSPHLPSHHAA